MIADFFTIIANFFMALAVLVSEHEWALDAGETLQGLGLFLITAGLTSIVCNWIFSFFSVKVRASIKLDTLDGDEARNNPPNKRFVYTHPPLKGEDNAVTILGRYTQKDKYYHREFLPQTRVSFENKLWFIVSEELMCDGVSKVYQVQPMPEEKSPVVF